MKIDVHELSMMERNSFADRVDDKGEKEIMGDRHLRS